MLCIRSMAVALAMIAAGWTSIGRAQVKLEWKFPPDSREMIESTSKVHQILTIKGTDIETSADSATTILRTVGARRPDGRLPIGQKVESMRNQTSLPGGVMISFDSANPDAKPENEQFAYLQDIYKLVVGLDYTVVLDGEDKVVAVEGTEAVEAKAQGLKPGASLVLKGLIEAATLRREFEQELGILPTILVREGDSWDRTEILELGGGQAFTCVRRYEYKGTVREGDRELDKIEIRTQTVTLATDPDSALPAKVTKSDLKVDSSEGTILFDRREGRRVKSDLKTRIKGELTLSINGTDLPAQLDLTLESGTKLQNPAK